MIADERNTIGNALTSDAHDSIGDVLDLQCTMNVMRWTMCLISEECNIVQDAFDFRYTKYNCRRV